MRFTWGDAKRKLNIEQHGFDFADAQRIFEGPTYTYEDDRFDYSERRFVTLDILGGLRIFNVHTETPRVIRIISMRKATKHEQTIFFKSI